MEVFGLLSFGLAASALPGLEQALPRLSRGVADQLILDDEEAIVADYLAYDDPEFAGCWPAATEQAT